MIYELIDIEKERFVISICRLDRVCYVKRKKMKDSTVDRIVTCW